MKYIFDNNVKKQINTRIKYYKKKFTIFIVNKI